MIVFRVSDPLLVGGVVFASVPRLGLLFGSELATDGERVEELRLVFGFELAVVVSGVGYEGVGVPDEF